MQATKNSEKFFTIYDATYGMLEFCFDSWSRLLRWWKWLLLQDKFGNTGVQNRGRVE